MLRVIVNADDFGLTERVNEGILRAHQCGILTSASIMANGAALDHAVEISRKTPSLDMGIHLTLVEERPILKRDEIPSLVDGTGAFHRHAAEFMKKYLTGRICLGEVRRELEAQITKVMRSGLEITHLDSHQHLHILPGILETTLELAREFRIPAVRLPRETIGPALRKRGKPLLRCVSLLPVLYFCRRAQNLDFLRTDFFVGFVFSGHLTRERLLQAFQFLPRNGTCELMCHPGLDDSHTPYKHWRYGWSTDLETLTDPEVSAFISGNEIRLISFRELIEP